MRIRLMDAMRSSLGKLLLGMVNILFAALMVSCADVKPWERGNLAKPHMASEPFPLQAGLREHVYGAREAGSGVVGSQEGAGCGCY